MRGAVSILAGNQESNATQENGRGRKRRRMARPLKGMRSGRTQPSKRRSGKWKESAKTGRGTPKFCAPHNQNGTMAVILQREKRRDINRNSGAPFKKWHCGKRKESVKTGGDSKILCTTQPERNSDRPFIARKTAGYKQEQQRALQKSGTMGDGKNASKPAGKRQNVYTPKGSLAGIFRYRQKRRGLQRNSV